ncbi:MAG: hypothetical protein ACTHON_09250 [Humibacter sp.]
MPEEIDYAARVARGIALMDEKWPNWATEIDLDRLDIKDGAVCMTAQYAQAHNLGGYWYQATQSLGLADEGDDYEAHGFNTPGGRDQGGEFATLNGLWRAEILRRRAQADQAPAEPEESA